MWLGPVWHRAAPWWLQGGMAVPARAAGMPPNPSVPVPGDKGACWGWTQCMRRLSPTCPSRSQPSMNPRPAQPRDGRCMEGQAGGAAGPGMGSASYSATGAAGQHGPLPQRWGVAPFGVLLVGTPWIGECLAGAREPPDAGLPASPGVGLGTGLGLLGPPLLPDRLKLDSWRSLMPPCRVAGRVGVSARGVPVSFFPACTTTATSPRYGVRSTPRSFKLCQKGKKKQRERQPSGHCAVLGGGLRPGRRGSMGGPAV